MGSFEPSTPRFLCAVILFIICWLFFLIVEICLFAGSVRNASNPGMLGSKEPSAWVWNPSAGVLRNPSVQFEPSTPGFLCAVILFIICWLFFLIAEICLFAASVRNALNPVLGFNGT